MLIHKEITIRDLYLLLAKKIYIYRISVMEEKRLIGELLLENGFITEKQLEKALSEHEKTKEKIGKVLIRLGIISSANLGNFLSQQFGIPYVNLESYPFDFETVSVLPEGFIRSNFIIPLKKDKDTLEVAVVPPVNPSIIENVRLITGLTVKQFITTDVDFEQAVSRTFDLKFRAERYVSTLSTGKESKKEVLIINDTVTNEASILNLLNSILSDSIIKDASDIHIEPFSGKFRVRYRIDGIIYDNIALPVEVAESLISRIKVSAGLDIAERRRSQEGGFSMQYRDKFYDFRVSSMGTSLGEKIAIRILSRQSILIPLENLGMISEQQILLQKLVKKQYGIILVSGPTGSGKTTTLYSIISSILNSANQSIVTLEDPVEYNIPGIVQIQINEEIGIDFSSGVISVLRLDPNIIMIGEIRDKETARVAIEASLTGHLVFASIHTYDAASAPIRLLELGIEPYLVESSLIGVISQRLVRLVCPNCRKEYEPTLDEVSYFKEELKDEVGGKLSHGEGCPICNFSGYKGRTGIFEIFDVNDKVKKLFETKPTRKMFYDVATKIGMITMKQSALKKIVENITTIDEVKRVLGET